MNTNVVPTETIELSAEDKIKELEKQLKELRGNIPIQENEDEFVDDIKQDEYINIMSLCPHTLNLSTLGKGKGKIFKFTQFGQKKRVLYRELVDIMEYDTTFLNNGVFYILDKRVIRKHGLNDDYSKFLGKEQIELILGGNKDVAIELYNSSNKKQKDFINELFILELKKNPNNVNMNVVSAISKISGQDIEKIANENFDEDDN